MERTGSTSISRLSQWRKVRRGPRDFMAPRPVVSRDLRKVSGPVAFGRVPLAWLGEARAARLARGGPDLRGARAAAQKTGLHAPGHVSRAILRFAIRRLRRMLIRV